MLELLPHQIDAIHKFNSSLVNKSSPSDNDTRRRSRTDEDDNNNNDNRIRNNNNNYAHQTEGFLLLHEMGLGKTITALKCATSSASSSLTRTLICCPSSLTEQWSNEIEKIFSEDTTTTVNNGKNTNKEVEVEILDFSDVVKYGWKKVKESNFDNTNVFATRDDGKQSATTKQLTLDDVAKMLGLNDDEEQEQVQDNDDVDDDEFVFPSLVTTDGDDEGGTDVENDNFFNNSNSDSFALHHQKNEKVLNKKSSTSTTSSSKMSENELLLFKNLLEDRIKASFEKSFFHSHDDDHHTIKKNHTTRHHHKYHHQFVICPFSRMSHMNRYLIEKATNNSETTDELIIFDTMIIDEVQLLCYRGGGGGGGGGGSTLSRESSSSSSSSFYANAFSIASSSLVGRKLLLSGYPIQNHLGEVFWMMKLAFAKAKDRFDDELPTPSAVLRKKFLHDNDTENNSSSSYRLFQKAIVEPIERHLSKANCWKKEKEQDQHENDNDEDEIQDVRAMTLLCLMLHDCCDLKERIDIDTARLPQIEFFKIMCKETSLQKRLAEGIRKNQLLVSSSAETNNTNNDDEDTLSIDTKNPDFFFTGHHPSFSMPTENQLIRNQAKAMTQMMERNRSNNNNNIISNHHHHHQVPPLVCANWLCQLAVDPLALPEKLRMQFISSAATTEDYEVINEETKLDITIRLLEHLFSSPNEKIVLFSHSVRVLELIAQKLREPQNHRRQVIIGTNNFELVTGLNTPKQRHQILSKFISSSTAAPASSCDDHDCSGDRCVAEKRILLASIRACGVGYNYFESFTTAIIIDSRWSPAHEHQAEGRICRLLSLSNENENKNNSTPKMIIPKKIFRILTEGTVDETFEQIQNHKRRLFRSVFDNAKVFAQHLRVKLTEVINRSIMMENDENDDEDEAPVVQFDLLPSSKRSENDGNNGSSSSNSSSSILDSLLGVAPKDSTTKTVSKCTTATSVTTSIETMRLGNAIGVGSNRVFKTTMMVMSSPRKQQIITADERRTGNKHDDYENHDKNQHQVASQTLMDDVMMSFGLAKPKIEEKQKRSVRAAQKTKVVASRYNPVSKK